MSDVWREGDRIRRADSLGYGDIVPTDEILERVAAAEQRMREDRDYVDFARQVLAFRAGEATAARPPVSSTPERKPR